MPKSKNKNNDKKKHRTFVLDSDDESEEVSSPDVLTSPESEASPESLSRMRKKGKNHNRGRDIQIEDWELDDDYALDIDDVADIAQQEVEALLKGKERLVEKTFDAQDQQYLSENEHMRFMNPSQKVGHALIGKDKTGRLTATQFHAPGTQDSEAPQIVKLKDIELVRKYGALHAQATAEDGTKMISKRSIDVSTNIGSPYAQDNQLFFFSPEMSHQWKGKVWWGADESKQPPLFREMDEEEKAELKEELAEIKPEVRGGKMTIVHSDVPVRDGMKRKPTQNGVMKRSAIDAYEEFFDEYEDDLSDEMKAIMQKSIDARPHWRSSGPKGQPRPEWLHAKGYGLTPLDEDPQQKSNLGSAPKWMNTKMMLTERALKWHALHRPDSELAIETNYTMLLGSDLVQRGMVEGTLIENGNTVKLKQDLNPFVKNPNFHKPTDIAQTTLVAHHLLQENPSVQSAVKVATNVKSKYGASAQYRSVNQVQLNVEPSSDRDVSMAKSKFSESETKHSHTKPKPSKEAGMIEIPKKKSKKVSSDSSSKKLMPTKHRFEQSVVQIYSTFHQEDYEMPWNGTDPQSCTGSGFVIEKNGKHYLLTNAHVVESSAFLQVRLANDNRKFTAKPLQVSYQADIAILEVEDPEFQLITKPVKIGDMVKLEDDVAVVGFPMGGEEISTTKGIISRIQVDDYVEGGERNLQAQTDSAINPGNSGGPVFDGDKVVGIAFQGIDAGDGLGYIIPTPIINHFLEDFFSPGAYKGFPTLNIAYQTLGNPAIRDSLNLDSNQTGIRITRVDDLSDAHGKLKEGDILLAVDGHNISNDGKAHIPGIGSRIDLNYLFQSKQVNENVRLTVLRQNPNTHENMIKEFDVKLKYRPGQTKLVEGYEFEKQPTYYIASGVLFQPLTSNYLVTPHGKQIREMVISKYGYINDVPKKHENQQLVIINRIFNSEITKDYDFFENNVVKKINGVTIDHISDVVKAIESNPKAYHNIEVASGELLVVKNLSRAENKELLKPYRVKKDRSEDLKTKREQKVHIQQSSKGKEEESAPVSVHTERNSIRASIAKNYLKSLGIDPGVIDELKACQEIDWEAEAQDFESERKAIKSSKKSKKSSKTSSSKSELEEEIDLAAYSDSDVGPLNDYDYDDSFIEEDNFDGIFDAPPSPLLMSGALKARTEGGATFANVVNRLEAVYSATQGKGKEEAYESSDDQSYDESSEEVFELSDDDVQTPPQRRRSSRLRKRAH